MRVSTGLFVALVPCLVSCLVGCGETGVDARSVSIALERALDDVTKSSADLRRALERKAVLARERLDGARQAAEDILTGPLERPEGAVEDARRRAEQALRSGASFLQQAAHDGGDAAEKWARVIQERMMRLQEAVDALSADGREHVES